MRDYFKKSLFLIIFMMLAISIQFILNIIVYGYTRIYVEMFIYCLMLLGVLTHTSYYYNKALKKIEKNEEKHVNIFSSKYDHKSDMNLKESEVEE